MSLTVEARRRIIWRTLIATVSGMGWCLALASSLSVFSGGWRLIQGVRAGFVRAGLAGQGHCWLCGMSHAFRALWLGHLQEAMAYNSRAVALFSVMIAMCASILLLWLPLPVRKRRQTGLALKRQTQ